MAVDSPKAWCSNRMVLCPSSYGYSDNIWNIVVSHALLISTLELSGQFHASAALPPGKTPPPRYLLCRRLGGPQSRSGRYGQDKNLSTLPGLELQFLHHPAPNLVTILTELSRIRWSRIFPVFYGTQSLVCLSERIPLWSFALTTFIHTTPSSSFFEIHFNIILSQHQIPRSHNFPLNFPAELLYKI